jgi:hypothetical protein
MWCDVIGGRCVCKRRYIFKFYFSRNTKKIINLLKVRNNLLSPRTDNGIIAYYLVFLPRFRVDTFSLVSLCVACRDQIPVWRSNPFFHLRMETGIFSFKRCSKSGLLVCLGRSRRQFELRTRDNPTYRLLRDMCGGDGRLFKSNIICK